MLLQGFSKVPRNISRKYFLKKNFMKYYEKISKRFLGKIFLWNRKCIKIFLTPCKNILRKFIRKPFKNISCIIAGNVWVKFLQRWIRYWHRENAGIFYMLEWHLSKIIFRIRIKFLIELTQANQIKRIYLSLLLSFTWSGECPEHIKKVFRPDYWIGLISDDPVVVIRHLPHDGSAG